MLNLVGIFSRITRIRSTKDIIERFQVNWNGYIYEYRVFLILTVLAALADMASTIYFMLEEGSWAEGHPAVRLVSAVLGPIFGPIIGKLCQFIVIIALTVYLRRQAVYIFIAVIIFYTWAAWYNIWG